MISERSLSQRCVHEILDMIRHQKLQPGQRLGEVAMARRLKLGRAPVRAAFDQLARAGLLERIARSGTFVRRVTLQDWCELMDLRAGVESMSRTAGQHAFERRRTGKASAVSETPGSTLHPCSRSGGEQWKGRGSAS